MTGDCITKGSSHIIVCVFASRRKDNRELVDWILTILVLNH